MKRNVLILGAVLGVAVMIGMIGYFAELFGGGDTKTPSATPTPLVAPTETPQQGDETTKTPAVTATPKPTEAPQATSSPTATPTLPPSPTVTEAPQEDLTAEEAMELLARISADELGLASDLSCYRLEADSWTSNIHGTVCICINVIPDVALGAGEEEGFYCFYFAVDRSCAYRMTEDNMFEEITLP